MIKHFNVQNLLWLALVLALAGSLKHLAAIFASIDGSTFMGLLQAIAIDAGLFALSFSLRGRKAEKRGLKVLWLGIFLFTAISVYGNFAYGLLATGEELPAWIVASRPVLLAASLPILVLYLAELISDNKLFSDAVEYKRRRFAQFTSMNVKKGTSDWRELRVLIWERDGKRCADCNTDLSETIYHCHHFIPEFEGGPGSPDNLITLCAKCHKARHKDEPTAVKGLDLLDLANQKRQATKEEKKSELLTILQEQPDASNSELATRLGVSRATVRNYKNELNGQVAK
jgi:5-methylcytosine-specific restriction endonuclease McrA